MAWTDACKLEAVAQIDRWIEIHGGVRPAIRELSKESGIPYNTLQKWYHPRKNESVAENGYTPKAEETKQTTTTCDLHTLNVDASGKKILFELVETDGNRLLAMQEYRVGRGGKEKPTKNRLTMPVELIAKFRSVLDQVEAQIQEGCSGGLNIDGTVSPEAEEAETPAGDDEDLAQDNAVDLNGGDKELSPAPADATVDTAVEVEPVQCVDCVHFAVKKGAPEENVACNSRSGSWSGPVFQPPHEPHPCPNFQDGQPG